MEKIMSGSQALFSLLKTHSLFKSSTLIDSTLVRKELLGWSLDGALDPWSCFIKMNGQAHT